MIPKFFRCGDPSGKCPLAVTREIVREQPGFTCPCGNESCTSHREKVGIVDVLTNGRSKLVYIGAAALGVLIVALILLSGGDSGEKALDALRTRLALSKPNLMPSKGGPRA